MKKIAVIIFLSTFLFSKTELYQLFKIPLLVTHYQEHKQQNRSISFWQFLCIHYAHGDVKDADYDRDMKLPFKTADYTGYMVTSVFVPFSNCSHFITPVFYWLPKKVIRNNSLIPVLFSPSIWQPPRLS